MKNGYLMGMIAGAIAGLIDNFASVTSMLIPQLIGWWESMAGTLTWTFSFLIAQFTSHLAINMIWGIVFGLIYAQIYDRIPGKGVSKGIVFSLVFYLLISNIRMGTFSQSYGMYEWTFGTIWTGFFGSLAFGLVLGYLYKKPTK